MRTPLAHAHIACTRRLRCTRGNTPPRRAALAAPTPNLLRESTSPPPSPASTARVALLCTAPCESGFAPAPPPQIIRGAGVAQPACPCARPQPPHCLAGGTPVVTLPRAPAGPSLAYAQAAHRPDPLARGWMARAGSATSDAPCGAPRARERRSGPPAPNRACPTRRRGIANQISRAHPRSVEHRPRKQPARGPCNKREALPTRPCRHPRLKAARDRRGGL